MKTFKLFSVVAAAALVLLTSCLGDSNNTRTLQKQFAVARIDSKTFKTVLDVSGLGAVYSPNIELQVTADQCYFIDLTVDFSSAENANAADNGYYLATVGNIDPITKGVSIRQVADTTVLLADEQPVAELGIATYLSGHFLMGAAFDQLKDQRNRWELSYDPAQEPKEDKNGNRYYDLFIRVVKQYDGEGSSTKEQVYRAFEAKSFVDKCIEKEKAEGKSAVNFKFNYLKSFTTKDNKTEMTWTAYSATMPFATGQ